MLKAEPMVRSDSRGGTGKGRHPVAGFVVAVACSIALQAVAAAQDVSSLKKHNVKQPIDISADSLEVKTKDNTAVFQGNVEAVQDDLKLMAERLTVYYRTSNKADTADDKPAAITRIDASGDVKLSSASEAVSSNWGVYDLDTRIITLGGAVVLSRGNTTIRGDRLQLDLETGLTRIEGAEADGAGNEGGRVKGSFVPPAKNN